MDTTTPASAASPSPSHRERSGSGRRKDQRQCETVLRFIMTSAPRNFVPGGDEREERDRDDRRGSVIGRLTISRTCMLLQPSITAPPQGRDGTVSKLFRIT